MRTNFSLLSDRRPDRGHSAPPLQRMGSKSNMNRAQLARKRLMARLERRRFQCRMLIPDMPLKQSRSDRTAREGQTAVHKVKPRRTKPPENRGVGGQP